MRMRARSAMAGALAFAEHLLRFGAPLLGLRRIRSPGLRPFDELAPLGADLPDGPQTHLIRRQAVTA